MASKPRFFIGLQLMEVLKLLTIAKFVQKFYKFSPKILCVCIYIYILQFANFTLTKKHCERKIILGHISVVVDEGRRNGKGQRCKRHKKTFRAHGRGRAAGVSEPERGERRVSLKAKVSRAPPSHSSPPPHLGLPSACLHDPVAQGSFQI